MPERRLPQSAMRASSHLARADKKSLVQPSITVSVSATPPPPPLSAGEGAKPAGCAGPTEPTGRTESAGCAELVELAEADAPATAPPAAGAGATATAANRPMGLPPPITTNSRAIQRSNTQHAFDFPTFGLTKQMGTATASFGEISLSTVRGCISPSAEIPAANASPCS